MQCIKTRIEWLKRIIAAVTGTCIFGDAATFIKDCRVLFGDIFIVPFLGPALGWTAVCSPVWGNQVTIDWNDLPVGREFDGKYKSAVLVSLVQSLAKGSIIKDGIAFPLQKIKDTRSIASLSF